jgi:hypothetical protein
MQAQQRAAAQQHGRRQVPIGDDEFNYLYEVGRYQGWCSCLLFCMVLLSALIWLVNHGFFTNSA